MPFVPTEVVEVRAWGRTVGALATGQRSRAYEFEYAPEWRATGLELSPLHLPVSKRGAQRFPGLNPDTWHGLPPAIADSLPDRFGNAIIDAEFARRGARPDEATPLDRLVYTGSRAMGALEFVPDTGPSDASPTTLMVGDLVDVARDVLAGTLGDDESETRVALQQILAIGTSAGGARAKAVVNLHPETRELRPGQKPIPGYESWLLKFDGVGRDRDLGTSGGYGRIEHAYALMAKAAGIVMTETRLLEENGRAHFMTRRFDRPLDGSRLHTQTLCALGVVDYNQIGTNDYAQLFQVIESLGLGQDARDQAFRRLVFNWMAANCDDHSKNHSFLMSPDGTWTLSPAYDVTHAHDDASRWTSAHLMGVNGRFRDIGRRELVDFAAAQRVKDAAGIIIDVATALRGWPGHAAAAGMQERSAEEVAADFLIGPLTRK
ncbi:type II toxin-antitoxin system HipA family toxin [Rathayibacter sp. Leaf296]|uniref:type II toxin-antitoxin system HipA family toxin n=1 Tax=Rathayibacter sp. Leaf296 TaxID=1736327 RepID=UPI0007024A5F|nr:type II toxin-antitoxin system HipA family toxin [Rathayibacter sp. Leaf296]KQQ09943.1 hypothetical protein ASF46_02200 [Rathayibacter sp. Leaf296]